MTPLLPCFLARNVGVLVFLILFVPGIGDAKTPAAPDTSAAVLDDLPLIEVPARATAGHVLVVHLTGDGGYGVTDKGIANRLADNGVPVVVLNTRRYFWTVRTPVGASVDLARILRHYLSAWNADRFVMVGYSFGADVAPFLLTRLPADLRARLRLLVLLGPSEAAHFHLTLGDLIVGESAKGPYKVAPELERLRGTPMECFYGEKDKEAIGGTLDPTLATSYKMSGGHRVGKNFDLIVRKILEGTRQQQR